MRNAAHCKAFKQDWECLDIYILLSLHGEIYLNSWMGDLKLLDFIKITFTEKDLFRVINQQMSKLKYFIIHSRILK